MDTLRIVEPLANFLIDIATKGTVLLMMAVVVTSALRRSSAAMRHRVWALAMLSLILLPVASLALPAWSVPILPATNQAGTTTELAISDETDARSAALPLSTEVPAESLQTRSMPSPESAVPSDPQPDDTGEPIFAPPVALADAASAELPENLLTVTDSEVDEDSGGAFAMVALVWSYGVTVFAVILASCLLQAVVLRRRSEVSTDPAWCQLLADLSRCVQLRRPVELREHHEAIVPLTWGVFWPVVLLPRKAREWTESMKRSGLLHELAHVQRSDVATQLLGRIACTMFWFHPLGWFALRQLRQEGEQACDDAVIRSGEKASDYAEQLLQVAHLCCVPRGLSLGVAMAEGSSLEIRVKSLFDKNRSHESVRRTVSFALTLVCTVALVGVSVIRPVASSAAVGIVDEPRTERASNDSLTNEAETEKMQPVTSRELTGIWQGVTDDFGVLIQFIGRESRLPGKKGVLSGKWTVHVPRGSIGSALEFNDNLETGVVDIEFAGFNTRTDKSFRASVGRIERGQSGQLYLTVLNSKELPKYPSILRLPLTHVSSEQAIQPRDIYHLFVAKELLEKGTIKDLPASISRILNKDESQKGNASRSPQLSVPEVWKTAALDRIVKLCPEFGPEHGGLKLGIVRSRGPTVFRMGDRIPLELFVMNVGSRDATFQFRCAPRVSYVPEVVDSKGQAVRGISGVEVFQPPYSVSLKPGEACSIPVSGLGIGDNGASSFKSPIAGSYQISYRVGSLKSATIRFNVGDDKSGAFRLDVLDERLALRKGSAERISILEPVFGEAKRGIQMGIAFASTRKKVSMGEVVPIDLFFRNVGNKKMKFEFYSDFYWSPPTVVNEQGERVQILPLPVWMYQGPARVTLGPGEVYGMQTRGLGLREGKGSLSLIAPAAGKYRIGFLRGIHDQSNPSLPWQKQVISWREQLISGSLEIDVSDGDDGTRYAKLLPGGAAPLKVLEADAKLEPLQLDGPPELPFGAPPSGPATENPTPSEPEPASPPEPPLDEQATKVSLKDVIWWKTADGLQAGFLLDSPAIPNQRVPFNSVARYRILVRNTTDNDIRFVARLLPHEGVDAPFLIPSDNMTESLTAPKLPERFRTEGVPRKFKRRDPAYIVTLAPSEAVIVPGQSGLDELSLYVGDAEKTKHPTAATIRPGMNWIVQPLQIQQSPKGGFPNGTSLMGRYKITRVASNGVACQESASRMVAVPGGRTLYPRIQLDVGTLTAAAVRNAKDAVWGKVDQGLQCGIRMINPQRAYKVGDTLEAEFLWRNTRDATIWSPLPRQSDLYPIVTNAEGQELSVDFGARMSLPAISLPFEPDLVRSLGVSKITLVEDGTPSPRSNLEPAHLIVEPGTYKLSGFGGISAPEGGRPGSGTIFFEVIRR
jgi:beta-lactamase regulating signal transducer with metallopeptidase domain